MDYAIEGDSSRLDEDKTLLCDRLGFSGRFTEIQLSRKFPEVSFMDEFPWRLLLKSIRLQLLEYRLLEE